MTRRERRAPGGLARLAAALLLGGGLAVGAAAQDRPAAPAGERATLTGKERLSAKGRDPTRVNDCKVPEALRDKRRRRAECADPGQRRTQPTPAGGS